MKMLVVFLLIAQDFNTIVAIGDHLRLADGHAARRGAHIN
jgi:hypothetical protein